MHPVIYGGLEQKNYIVETVGCGVAFLDFDNDGWLDIFVLCGTRMERRFLARRTGCTRTIAMAHLLM